MKILVIFTGGTIGSSAGEEYITLDNAKPYKLIELYRENYGREVEFHTSEPYTVLSENMDCKMYLKLAKEVKSHIDEGYDGIIVTHGSDTIQYSAAMLAYVLGNKTIPVMLVASNYVLEDWRANGLINFACAVEFIRGRRGRGVFVPYANMGENCKVHCALKLMPHLPYSDYLYSLDNMYYGEFSDNAFYMREKVCEKNDNLFHKEDGALVSKFNIEDSEKALSSCSHILWINVHPGMVCPEIPDDTGAILISPYHSGTICTEYDNLVEFLESAGRRGLPVYLAGANDGMDYESCRRYEAFGIKVLQKISPVAAYIRLWLEYGCGYLPPRV